jgi:hypothetical protein
MGWKGVQIKETKESSSLFSFVLEERTIPECEA